MKRYQILYILLFATLFSSCKENEFRYRDISPRLRLVSEVVTTSGTFNTTTARYDTVHFSFRRLDNDATEAIVRFEAHLVGEAFTTDRTFKLEVVPEGTNAPAGSYEIEPLILPTNAYYATVSVKVKRSIPGLDIADYTKGLTARIKFRVAPNENFLPYGDNNEFTLSWCDYFNRPTSWNATINTHVGQFSQSLYKFYMEVVGETEFTRYNSSNTAARALRSYLQRMLQEYNDLADAEGRPRWKADDGVTDLII